MNAVFDQQGFRRALGQYATGVAVAATLDPAGRPVGLTINSFASVSLDPPLVLWSILRAAALAPVFAAASGFAISVLGAEQQAIALGFSQQGGDRFATTPWRIGAGGWPLIDGAIAAFECGRQAVHPGGDHHILVGRVIAFSATSDPALGFHRGRFVALA